MMDFSDPPMHRIESWVNKSFRIPDAEFTVTDVRKSPKGSIVVHGRAVGIHGSVNRVHSAYWLAKWAP